MESIKLSTILLSLCYPPPWEPLSPSKFDRGLHTIQKILCPPHSQLVIQPFRVALQKVTRLLKIASLCLVSLMLDQQEVLDFKGLHNALRPSELLKALSLQLGHPGLLLMLGPLDNHVLKSLEEALRESVKTLELLNVWWQRPDGLAELEERLKWRLRSWPL